MPDDNDRRIIAPQPGPQRLLLSCPVLDVFYGGARGGGKTYGGLLDWYSHAQTYGDLARGIAIRRTYPELEDVIEQAVRLFGPVMLGYNKNDKTVRLRNGAELKFRHLGHDSDADKYQGHQYTWVWIEEAGAFPSQDPIRKMFATVRSGRGKVRKRFLLTGNPGGPGHNWLKAEYIDPSPPLQPFRVLQRTSRGDVEWMRVFIPAKVEDNKVLLHNDPEYVSRIAASAAGKEHLLRAWLDGAWDIVAGGMFDDVWDAGEHVLKPFPIPREWAIYRAYDWGSSKPYSIGWWAVSDGARIQVGDGAWRTFHPGTLFRVAELYGWNGQPNQGLRSYEKEVIAAMKEKESTDPALRGRRVRDGPADTNIFEVRDGESLADQWRAAGVRWKIADKSPGSRKTGWNGIRELLAEAKRVPMESRGMFVFDTCRQFIRTLPTLPRSDRDQDDVDTNAEDHVADETRYMVRHAPKRIVTRTLGGI